ncbi:kinase-like domain-containing protein [Xylaria sp. FL1042]|nr:kinase-like domain-containing protein [Xylaria sp. FL1042]
MWWDTSLIEATVTRQFVCSHLNPEEVERLDQQLGFGDGLTDGTYWEWIEKAKRIFLILADLGVPDQIFSIIDDSWDDDDLPIALSQVSRLSRTPTRDDKFAKKFYARQFHYLVHYIEKGKHVIYQDDDLVPVVVADKRPGLATNNAMEKVDLPNRRGEAFVRRRFSIGTNPGNMTMDNFLNEINSIRNLQSEHLTSYYASYIHQGWAYVIFTHAAEFNLKTLLTTTPGPWKSLAKQERRQLMMNWIHCLTDTLCYIHKQRRSHGNIKPSTILFCANNYIFYNSMSRMCGEAAANASEKSVFDRESYDFAAPEQWYRPSASAHRKNMMVQQSSASTSSDSTTFSISRGGSDTSGSGSGSSASSVLHTPNPLLDPQAADVFSLGCVILELLSLLMKRTTRAFASHRAAKHKLAGRGGAVLDSSFHKNLGQVESWMTGLAKDAAKKEKEGKDAVFRGIAPMLHVVARMLAVLPQERPTAREVEQAMYKILTEKCAIAEPHCVHQYGGESPLFLGGGGYQQQEQGGNYFSIATRTSRPGSSIGGHRRSATIALRTSWARINTT